MVQSVKKVHQYSEHRGGLYKLRSKERHCVFLTRLEELRVQVRPSSKTSALEVGHTLH